MKRILLFYKGKPFRTAWRHWLIEDDVNDIWVLSSDGEVRCWGKNSTTWKEWK